jgi:hypothetical protein
LDLIFVVIILGPTKSFVKDFAADLEQIVSQTQDHLLQARMFHGCLVLLLLEFVVLLVCQFRVLKVYENIVVKKVMEGRIAVVKVTSPEVLHSPRLETKLT